MVNRRNENLLREKQHKRKAEEGMELPPLVKDKLVLTEAQVPKPPLETRPALRVECWEAWSSHFQVAWSLPRCVAAFCCLLFPCPPVFAQTFPYHGFCTLTTVFCSLPSAGISLFLYISLELTSLNNDGYITCRSVSQCYRCFPRSSSSNLHQCRQSVLLLALSSWSGSAWF